jgi:hypothetical protein
MPIPQVTDRLKEAPAMVLRTVFAGIGQLLMAADKLRARLEEQFAPPAPPSPPAGQGEASSQQPQAAANVTLLPDRRGTAGQRPHTRPAGPAPAEAASSKPAATEPAAAGATAAEPAPAKATTAKPAATASAGTRPATARATTARATAPSGSKPAAAKTTTARATAPSGSKPAAAKATTAKATPAKAAPAKAKPATDRPATAKPATAKGAARTAPAPPIAGYDSLSVASLRARLRGLGPDGVRALLDYEQATTRRDDVITMYERRLARLADETG